MNQPMSLERMVATWMADAAATTAPSEQQLVEQIITATAQQRPRPRWLALLQESPMTAQSRVLVGRRRGRLALTAILLLIAAIAAAGIGAYLVQQQKPASSDDWPGFRGDAAHSGVVGHGPIGNPVVAWKTSLAGPVRNAVSILGDDTFVASDDGTLTAFGTTDGAKHWTFSAPAPMGGPYSVGGVVYAVDGEGVVHAIKAADGTPVWASTVKIAGATDGVVSGGLLYYASSDGVVVALDTKTGAEAWRRAASPTPITMKFPTVANDLLIAADLHGFMTALDASSGEVRWAEQSADRDSGHAGHRRWLCVPRRRLGCHEREPGRPQGERRQRAVADRPPAVRTIHLRHDRIRDGPGRDHRGDRPDLGQVRCGKPISRPARCGRPRSTDTTVYGYTDSTRTLFALDRATGGELWTFQLDGSNQCCIALSKGNVYVATEVGTVYAIAGDNATLAVGPIPQAVPSAVAPRRPPRRSLPPRCRHPSSSGSPITDLPTSSRG